MRSTSDDLSITSYAIVALMIMAQAVFDFPTALIFGACLVALWIAISLLLAGGSLLTSSRPDAGRPYK